VPRHHANPTRDHEYRHRQERERHREGGEPNPARDPSAAKCRGDRRVPLWVSVLRMRILRSIVSQCPTDRFRGISSLVGSSQRRSLQA
jgi:hypothetical protein